MLNQWQKEPFLNVVKTTQSSSPTTDRFDLPIHCEIAKETRSQLAAYMARARRRGNRTTMLFAACASPVLAHFGHAEAVASRPLSAEERKALPTFKMTAFRTGHADECQFKTFNRATVTFFTYPDNTRNYSL
jgi:hypothetical protein